jgi:pimeloyl-ACP methyl ester carboxylesterase
MISKTIDLGGEPIHYADFGGEGPVVVLVHGLGGSHLNWLALGPFLERRARVVALDLPGFGLSAFSPRGTSIDVMGAALARFIDAMSTEPVHLVGNSMGGMLSVLEGHARPKRIASALLICPALPPPRGAKTDPQWLRTLLIACAPWGHVLLRRGAARIGPETMTREMIALCCVDGSKVPREVMEAHVALARERASMPWAERLRAGDALPPQPLAVRHAPQDSTAGAWTADADRARRPRPLGRRARVTGGGRGQSSHRARGAAEPRAHAPDRSRRRRDGGCFTLARPVWLTGRNAWLACADRRCFDLWRELGHADRME